MVDTLYHTGGRVAQRHPLLSTEPHFSSRRSSVSSNAGSVFSESSAASSASSHSVQSSSGWDSAYQYESDEELVTQLNTRINVETESRFYDEGYGSQASDKKSEDEKAASSGENYPTFPPLRDGSKVSTSHGGCGRAVAEVYNPQGQETEAIGEDLGHVGANAYTGSSQRPNRCDNFWPQGRVHPRRTNTNPSWSKPNLVRQEARRGNFVESLVDTATELVALIWPTASAPVPLQNQKSRVISLRHFVREVLKRSRTSFSTLQLALYYLALLSCSDHFPRHGFTDEQTNDDPSHRALQCGRRMFLSSLILACKYLQDRNYTAKAWSKISSLPVTEINRNERAFLAAVEYKLYFKPSDFQRWTEKVAQCTGAAQNGKPCPWIEALTSMDLIGKNFSTPCISPDTYPSQSLSWLASGLLQSPNRNVPPVLLQAGEMSTRPMGVFARAGSLAPPRHTNRRAGCSPLSQEVRSSDGEAQAERNTVPNSTFFTSSPESMSSGVSPSEKHSPEHQNFQSCQPHNITPQSSIPSAPLAPRQSPMSTPEISPNSMSSSSTSPESNIASSTRNLPEQRCFDIKSGANHCVDMLQANDTHSEYEFLTNLKCTTNTHSTQTQEFNYLSAPSKANILHQDQSIATYANMNIPSGVDDSDHNSMHNMLVESLRSSERPTDVVHDSVTAEATPAAALASQNLRCLLGSQKVTNFDSSTNLPGLTPNVETNALTSAAGSPTPTGLFTIPSASKRKRCDCLPGVSHLHTNDLPQLKSSKVEKTELGGLQRCW